MAKTNLTAEVVRDLLDYTPESGELRWRYARSGISPGVAGCIGGPGYLYVRVLGEPHLAHRLIWLHVHGHWPKNDIDHINCIRTDNRLANLRDVERHVNNQNRSGVRSDNKSSGMTGVSWHVHSRKWRARIWLKGKEYRVGLFDTQEQASDAYVTAKRVMHEGCTI